MKNVLITGAGGGIGYEMVQHLLKDANTQVVAVSRNLSRFKDSERLIKVSADITNIEFLPMLKKALNTYSISHIDVLINNAGLLVNKAFSEMSTDDVMNQFNVNYVAAALLIKEMLPYMGTNSNQAKRAHIVNISSMGGFQGSSKYPGLSHYSASKAALNILSECLATELADQQIAVNALALGAVNTEMLKKAFPDYTAPIEPKDMAEFIIEFALKAHTTINGQVIPVKISNP